MAQVLGVGQHSRRCANRQPRHAITDRKPLRLSPKQPLSGGLGKKQS